ncbi:phosphoglucomutase/phosphomannomutase family protein [Natronomonas gomsonensis]|jgi:phosphomannomutase|uniref:phosphoglucomutase/phosphomannomutase family protein n=1 Tax=Natronomonas gomsonensis TaxID=1046043 RepID=UPI0020CA60C3|nr:phosphoglucomutase/phosphomannomutase family protein [Natronomonas gomsonensis]MCY4729495.1 phosphoglucomutase/phosphomannomutase family protein [Natronomonas gomsonensis]
MDIEFGTDGWRTTVEEFTTPRIRAVGQAVADYVREGSADPAVAVGYDPREGSRDAAEELCRVLCVNGVDAYIPDRDTPTPVVAWTVLDRQLDGALQVTASHNPPEYNGIKFVPDDGAPALPGVTDWLADNLRVPDPLPESEWGHIEESDFIDPYLDHALAFAGKNGRSADCSGVTVAHDAMHGSGRGVTDELLERAGAEVLRLRNDADPEFGGSPPEPSAARLRDLETRVTDGEANLGVANDGDSDRIGVVTPDRGYVDPNWLFVALYDYLLETDDGDAVRTVSTTFLVDRVAEAHGQSVRETPVGFKWVAEAMGEFDALVGGEESGGFGVRGHLRNKDGVLVALLVAAAHAEESLDDRLDRLRAEHGDIVQDRISVDCPDERKTAVLDELDGSIPDSVAGTAVESVGTADGFKLVLEDGSWLLVRPSGTEPKLRVYAEAGDRDRVEELLESGAELVRPLI